jgi:hypothetical protein
MNQPTAPARRQQHINGIADSVGSHRTVDFFNLLTGPELFEWTESELPDHRERLYPPTVTLSMFIQQTLSSDASCQHAVNSWAAQRAAEGLPAHCAKRQNRRLLSGTPAFADADGSYTDPQNG